MWCQPEESVLVSVPVSPLVSVPVSPLVLVLPTVLLSF
jgi:hypothetical protein